MGNGLGAMDCFGRFCLCYRSGVLYAETQQVILDDCKKGWLDAPVSAKLCLCLNGSVDATEY